MKIKHILKPADFVTMGNLIFGVLTIFAAMNRMFMYAACFLLAAVLCDFLDGKVARMSKKTNEVKQAFGKELDSLADVVSFGVAPAVFGFAQGLNSWISVIILLFFTVAGMLRLSRFNVTDSSGGYEGVPITFNGVIFPILFFISLQWPYPIMYNLIMYVIMGFAMLSTKKVKKLI